MVARVLSTCHDTVMEKNEILLEFGKNLRAERNRAGYSQDGLAEKIGICAGTLFPYTTLFRSNPTLTTIVAIMEVLNIGFDKLYDLRNK